jgi:hypothetical protein
VVWEGADILYDFAYSFHGVGAPISPPAASNLATEQLPRASLSFQLDRISIPSSSELRCSDLCNIFLCAMLWRLKRGMTDFYTTNEGVRGECREEMERYESV